MSAAPAAEPGSVVELAPAKINLDLLVTGRRTDGYRELDSLVVFAPEFADRIAAEPADELTLAWDDGRPDWPERDDLIVRAARALAAAAGVPARVRLRCAKRIWVAAGLGGGSADAAATLRALNRLWRLDAAPDELARIGLSLGADVPACLASSPLRMRGLGERIEPLDTGAPLPMLLANPGVALSTAAVFAGLDRLDAPRPGEPPALTDRDALLAHLAATGNALEIPARRLAPAVGDTLDALRALPFCRLARMSGSGATCFALFADDGGLQAALAALQEEPPPFARVAVRAGHGSAHAVS